MSGARPGRSITAAVSTSGSLSAISSNLSEAPSGVRAPCSQERTVLRLTFSRPANSRCERLRRWRIRLIRSASLLKVPRALNLGVGASIPSF